MTCCTCRVCSRWSWFGSSSSRMFNLIQHFCLNLQVVVYILSFLHASDRKEASLVCRSWYSASQDPRFQVTLPRPQQRRWIERWLHILTVFFFKLQRNITFRFPASASSLELIRGLGRKPRCSLIISQLDGFSISRSLLLEVQYSDELNSSCLTHIRGTGGFLLCLVPKNVSASIAPSVKLYSWRHVMTNPQTSSHTLPGRLT